MRFHTIMRHALALAGVAFALALPGCQSVQTTQPGVVGVERKQLMLVPEDQLRQSAAQAYQQTLQVAQQKGALNPDPQMLARVRRVVGRLVPATAAFRSDAPNWPWRVNVIQSNQLNAWAMPGGRIAVYSGLITRLDLTDAELAAILGHEMAHALREHAREQVSRQMAEQLGFSVAGAALGLGESTQQIAQVLTNVTFNLPHSRQAEQEADRIGVELAARAGYDPRAAVSVWQKMQKAQDGGGSPQFLSTHPAPGDRLADVRQYAERVMPLYRSAQRS